MCDRLYCRIYYLLKACGRFFRRFIPMTKGDCFRLGKNVILCFCRTTNVGLHMFAAIDINTNDVYGKMLKDDSLKYLKPLNKKIFNRIAKKC